MIVSKSVKSRYYKFYQRKSLFVSLKSKYWKRKSHRQQLFLNIQRIFQSIYFFTRFIFQLFILFDQLTRRIFLFIEQFQQIIRVIYGWIQMICAIFTFLHLIINRLMLISFYIHRLCFFLSIIFQPLHNGTFEQLIRKFSRNFFYYYSSNGACYTLQDRTRHIARQMKAQWSKNYQHIKENTDDIFYDAFDDEYQWL